MRQETTRTRNIMALALAALMLAGCYISNRLLLDPEAAAHPLDDGVYARADGSDRWRVSRALDGWYAVEHYNMNGTIGETRRVLFNDLPLGALSAFAVAEQTDEGFVYAVIMKTPKP